MRTIAAISSPRGKGGVSLIRISGDEALQVSKNVFRPFGTKDLASQPRKQVYGSFVFDGEEFDDGLACYFAGPNSFTGEDVVELCCHGGVYCTQKLLSACFAGGAAPAEAGEFTKRAFINGRLSLTRAEAIGGIIDAKTDAGLRISLLQSRGALSDGIREMYQKLSLIAASAYAFIDYPTEDLTDISPDETLQGLNEVYQKLQKLCASHSYGKAVSEGIPTAIVGKPNVGKSSLLNFFAGEDRAIVTSVAGTTRDVITVQIKVGDIILDLSDTAGVRGTDDAIEQIGVQKSLEQISKAELILAVFDASRPLDGEDNELIKYITDSGKQDKVIAIINKTDSKQYDVVLPFANTVEFSAKTGEGGDALKNAVRDYVGSADVESGEIILGARQYAAAYRAMTEVKEAIDAMNQGFTTDIALMNVEDAMQSLGEIDGREVSDQIVKDIFSHFCVGK